MDHMEKKVARRVSYGNGGEGSVTEKETGGGVGRRRPDVEFGHCDLGS